MIPIIRTSSYEPYFVGIDRYDRYAQRNLGGTVAPKGLAVPSLHPKYLILGEISSIRKNICAWVMDYASGDIAQQPNIPYGEMHYHITTDVVTS